MYNIFIYSHTEKKSQCLRGSLKRTEANTDVKFATYNRESPHSGKYTLCSTKQQACLATQTQARMCSHQYTDSHTQSTAKRTLPSRTYGPIMEENLPWLSTGCIQSRCHQDKTYFLSSSSQAAWNGSLESSQHLPGSHSMVGFELRPLHILSKGVLEAGVYLSCGG